MREGATLGCEALPTTWPPAEHHGGDAARLTDMDNVCESLHHRDKELAHGC